MEMYSSESVKASFNSQKKIIVLQLEINSIAVSGKQIGISIIPSSAQLNSFQNKL